jgi:hypothetical protein
MIDSERQKRRGKGTPLPRERGTDDESHHQSDKAVLDPTLML